jgi:membrane protein YqaA with SNARE-associated domain
VQKLIPRIIQRIAAKASAEFVEKWAARVIPVVSSALGGTLNYYFVRGWGERAHAHFRQKHFERRRQVLQAQQSAI